MSSRVAAIPASLLCSMATARAVTNPASPRMPLAFVKNRGQAVSLVRYIGTGPEFKAWFEDRGVILRHGRTTVKIVFEGRATPAGVAPQPSSAAMTGTGSSGCDTASKIGVYPGGIVGTRLRWRQHVDDALRQPTGFRFWCRGVHAADFLSGGN